MKLTAASIRALMLKIELLRHINVPTEPITANLCTEEKKKDSGTRRIFDTQPC